MKFDRNTVLGFVILGALFFAYFFYNSREQAAFRKKQAREQFVKDSTARANRPPADTMALKIDSARNDSAQKVARVGNFQEALDGDEKLIVIENDLMRVTFTNRGGRPKKVELKNFKGQDSNWVRLAATDQDRISYAISTGSNRVAQTGDLIFPHIDSVKNADGSQTISFTLVSSDSASPSTIVHKYTVRQGDYMMDFSAKLKGASLLSQGIMNLTWQYTAAQQESDISFEKQNTQVGYIKDGSFDYHTIGRRSSKTFDEPVSWIGVRQRFFVSFLVAKNNFTSGRMEWQVPSDTAKTIVRSTANMKLQLPLASEVEVPFNIYYGPSDYHTLKRYDMRFEKLVNLGQGMYAFVRPINKFVVLPTFDLMKGWAGNLGIAIALLTLVIRLVISPLTYSSYLSGAKMKALRPEIAKLREKYGKDQQQMSMEQMKLFREAGVNPLGGCIPALLQIPIFFALYSFFNSEIGLRGAHFLWSNDLSAFDAVINFGTHIPLLGSHLSMFTITAVLTSFLISIYSMSMSPDQSNPVLKYMPYIFPVFLLFIFNRLPSALTWYYTVSNLITLLLQFVIQNYIINHDKVLAKIEENRKKPKTKSKWQERMEQMQEQQKKMKEMQQKSRR
jgi:YidC/Oxa1 family membrane protein insertase